MIATNALEAHQLSAIQQRVEVPNRLNPRKLISRTRSDPCKEESEDQKKYEQSNVPSCQVADFSA